MTSIRPDSGSLANTSGTPGIGFGSSTPFRTMRNRPPISVTSTSPFGRNAKLQGKSSPSATLWMVTGPKVCVSDTLGGVCSAARWVSTSTRAAVATAMQLGCEKGPCTGCDLHHALCEDDLLQIAAVHLACVDGVVPIDAHAFRPDVRDHPDHLAVPGAADRHDSFPLVGDIDRVIRRD